MTDDDDPIKAAVEQSLREQITAWWQTPPRLDLAADVAVQAHRRAVLDRRDDGEMVRRITGYLDAHEGNHLGQPWSRYLLAALADAEIARRQSEADRDVLVRVRTKAAALLDGELAHRSRDYGRGVAQATRDILAALDGEADSRPGD